MLMNVQDWDFKQHVQKKETEQMDYALQAIPKFYNGPHNWIMIWEKN